MNKKLLAILTSLMLIFAGGLLPTAKAQQGVAVGPVRVGGQYFATAYSRWSMTTTLPTLSGSATLNMLYGWISLPDGRPFVPFSVQVPLSVDVGANRETVTPTAVGNCFPLNPNQGICTVTATFANAHGAGTLVVSGDGGLGEAILDAEGGGQGGPPSGGPGGVVVVDQSSGVTNAQLTAATPWANVSILDVRNGAPVYWNAMGGATVLAAPTTLVATTAGFGVNGANFTGGAYTGSNTYIACIAYVDIMGQEGPCSATFTISTSGSATTDQIGFTAPAASTGAVGYTIYITLNGGSYVSSYKVPLVTQPTVVGSYPAGNGVCTLTLVETVTPACAVTNTTYNQTGVGAVVSALTVNTSPIEPQASVVSTTAIFVPNASGRTTYAYTPGNHVGTPGLVAASLPFAAGATTASTVPTVLGTVNVPPGFMNYLGRTLEVCGKATSSASTATIGNIQFQWDSIGQNTAGAGVQIGTLGLTPATAFATTAAYTFCEDFTTTVAGAGATAGSILPAGGYVNTSGVATAAAGQGASTDPGASAIGSLNLSGEARINVIYLHTTGSDTFTLKSLTLKVID